MLYHFSFANQISFLLMLQAYLLRSVVTCLTTGLKISVASQYNFEQYKTKRTGTQLNALYM